MAESKAARESREAAESNATAALPAEVAELGSDKSIKAAAKEREDRIKNWTAPDGHTTQLGDAIMSAGDAHIVDESLPANGVVEQPERVVEGVMDPQTVFGARPPLIDFASIDQSPNSDIAPKDTKPEDDGKGDDDAGDGDKGDAEK